MEINITKDYHMFNLLKYNRQVCPSHVENLKGKILHKNKLSTNPIIVDEDMNIIEGQHRFMAAKELGLDLYYIVDCEFQAEDIIGLNSGRLNWVPLDYVKFYSRHGNEEYTNLLCALNKYEIKVSEFLTLDKGDMSGKYARLKSGKFIFDKSSLDTMEKYLKTVDCLIKSGVSKNKIGSSNRRFLLACRVIFQCEFFDLELFLRQCERASHIISPGPDVAHYVQCFCDVYNFRSRQNKVKLVVDSGHCSVVPELK